MQTQEPASEIAQWLASRAQLELATRDPALRRDAHRLLWDVCQMLRDPVSARSHLEQALAEDPLFTRPHLAAIPPTRSVLMLAVPGDYQANLPLDRLFDETTLLHTLWIPDAVRALEDPASLIPAGLPEVDCVFIAIAEDTQHQAALRAADRLAAAIGKPVINAGWRIAGLSRCAAALQLRELADLVAPAHHMLSPGEPSPVGYPAIIRPCGSHAGARLERVEDAAALRDYHLRHPGVSSFSVARFVDFRSADGQWRKYRVIFVDGVPYPLHLAIHDDWAIWYYNARMQDSPAKLAEERRFLDDISVLPEPALTALRAIGRRVGLDYFGLDCSVLPDGRLLVFEVETGMIVAGHGMAGARIRLAVERMLQRRALVPAVEPFVAVDASYRERKQDEL